MHPIAGDPTQYPEQYDVIDDSDSPNATNFNTPHEAEANRTAWLRAHLGSAGGDWRQEWAATSLVASSLMQNACWDSSTRRWVIVVVQNGATPLTRVFASPGEDDGLPAAWAPLGAAYLPAGALPFVASAVSRDPSTPGFYWLSTLTNGGSQTTDIALYNGSTWTSKFTTTASSMNTTELAVLGTRIIALFAGTGIASVISSGDSGATWPVGFTVSFSANGFELKSNELPVGSGGFVIAMPRNTAQATFHYWTSPDGTTWTMQHLAALDGSVQKVTGLTWGRDGTGNAWFLSVQVDGTHTATYRSPDGVGWTLVAAGPSNLPLVGAIAALERVIIATVTPTVDGGASSMVRTPDGALNWYANQGNFSSNVVLATVGYTRERVLASDVGYLAWNAQWLRFSNLTGRPATPLS